MKKIISLLLILGTLAFASVILNFDEVDIKTVATEIAKLTGKNLVIDPRVRGKITIISNRELTPQEALELFSQALAMQGYALIDEGSTIKILPSTQGVPFTRTKKSRGGELITMVYKLENVNAAQAINTIRPFLSPYGRVAHNQQANAIIIADYADSINKVRQILNLIDSGKSGGTVKVFNLEYVKPSYVARLLQPISTLSSKKYGEPSVFSAVDEVGSLAVYTHKDLLPLVEQIIKQVDTPESTETERSFYIIPLNFISAEEIYKSLSSLFKGIKTKSPRTVQTKNKKGTTVSFQTSTISLKSGMKIGIDKRSNSLILYATKAEYEAVKRFVRKLDVRRRQVLLSAAIVEASAKDILEKGIRWQILGTKGGAAFKGATLTDIFNAFQAGNFVIGAFSESGTKVNIGNVEFFFPDLVFLFSLLEQGTGFHVVSNPKILTLDNQEATIKVGQVVPFPTGIKYDVNGNPIITYDYKDVGLELKITPRITEKNIRLIISLTLKEITGYLTNEVAGLNYTVPITSNRELNSDVVIENGQTVVIGGLISRKTLMTTEKVPLLGDIPLMGHLFRYDKREKDKTSLFIFITPYVVSSPQELSKITEEHKKLAEELMKALKKKEKKREEIQTVEEDEEIF